MIRVAYRPRVLTSIKAWNALVEDYFGASSRAMAQCMSQLVKDVCGYEIISNDSEGGARKARPTCARLPS